jgi:hypothetical protein
MSYSKNYNGGDGDDVDDDGNNVDEMNYNNDVRSL